MRHPVRKALFLDCEDSFSYNLVQELTEVGLEVKVIHWSELTEDHLSDLLVLGPGPGHPDDYQSIYPLIQSWLDQDKKIFGVCLGHQILWRLLGHEVRRSQFPLHGQKIQLNLNKDWQQWLKLPAGTWVQRYNSLAVTGSPAKEGVVTHEENSEIILSRSKNFISYQFHPESVGTNCRRSFFNVIFSNLL